MDLLIIAVAGAFLAKELRKLNLTAIARPFVGRRFTACAGARYNRQRAQRQHDQSLGETIRIL